MEPNTHTGFKLVTTPDKFYVVPSGETSETLEIDRLNFDLKLIGRENVPAGNSSQEICTLVGIIHLLAGPYLIVATRKRLVGKIDGQAVYEITEFDVISFAKTTIHLSEKQVQDNQTYLAMVQRVLATPGFYYSNSYDLTLSLQQKQHNIQTKPNFPNLSLLERADERFVWNNHLLRDFAVQPELRRFIVPVIHGFVSINRCTVNGKTFFFILISRRSVHRAGVRYYMRGVDDEGHVANYVETEQLILYQDYKMSFTQTRGSIPLYWSQRPNLKYKPTPVIDGAANHVKGIQKHFDEQIVMYGQQVIINLIDQKGSERKLGDSFKECITSLGSCLVGYVAFDFHKECSKLRWHRLSILIDKLAPRQDEFGYYCMKDPNGTVVSVQQGVFRSNCIDCLDRTNVVQSMLGRRSLEAQFQRVGILNVGERVIDKKEFNHTFKNIWADNADNCAKQYTGTGALKTDFTRTGKRTALGMLKDGYNSSIRYFYNNFRDGFRQDSIDLFLGSHVVDRWEGVAIPSPLHAEAEWRPYVLPIVLLLAISMLFMSLIFQSTDPISQIGYVLFWGAVVIVALLYIYKHGMEFIDKPRLTQKLKTS